jgi:hypothetical protein
MLEGNLIMGSKKKKRKQKKKSKFREFLENFAWGFGYVAFFGVIAVFSGDPDPDFGLPEVLLLSLGIGLVGGLCMLLLEGRKGGGGSGWSSSFGGSGGSGCGGCGGGGCGGGG